ncbi:unnamed protein product [Rhodiola kirilowii]
MADEGQYNSTADLSGGKRNYDDGQQLPSPPRRRATGFSAPIAPQASTDSRPAAPPASYSNVPPPVDEIQLAKQRAQEIAARLFNAASTGDAKRTRVENGSGGGYDSGDGGYGSGQTDYGQKAYGFSAPAPPPAPASYGGYNSGPSKKIEIPNGRVGVIIGKGGETIKYLQLQSGAKIQVQRDAEVDQRYSTRLVELTGTPDQVEKAEQLIQDVLKEAEVGGSGTVNRRFNGEPGGEQFAMQIPNNKVGLVIGKGGETIKSMQAQTGARIQRNRFQMALKVVHDLESTHASLNVQHEFWPLRDIDSKKAKFPCCLVWTPLPVVSWLAPYIGHVGICREDGSILDFSGSYFVNVDDFAFGSVARYVQLDREKCCFPPNLSSHKCKLGYKHAENGSALTWDDALQSSVRQYQSKSYNIFICNCHSFVANCLNRLCYNGSMDWNMVEVAALILFKGRWVDGMSIISE